MTKTKRGAFENEEEIQILMTFKRIFGADVLVRMSLIVKRKTASYLLWERLIIKNTGPLNRRLVKFLRIKILDVQEKYSLRPFYRESNIEVCKEKSKTWKNLYG